MDIPQIDISVIIVNYKVKEYIANLLNSIKKAKGNLNLEIFVVDNASGDGSIPYLRDRFPTVSYIENQENVGFGKANNQAIKMAKGEFTLIINPDTLVGEDTLQILVNHMHLNPGCGAAGCKILNPDGSFAPESRRSVPTIWSAACKVFGLNALFPKSKLFARYYLSWLDENTASKVPVLSGSFMFWRTSVLKDLEGFDERFFMYAEDIDLCYRIEQTGTYIEYLPETSIIHYKGESTKRGDLKYIRLFNKALYQFFDKHYSSRYSLLFKFLIYGAIWLRTLFSFMGNNFRQLGMLASDILVLNLSVILGFLFRFSFKYEVISNIQNLKYLWINVLASVLYVVLGGFLGMFKSQKDSVSTQLKTLTFAYSGVVLITFFVRDLAFSRLALIYGFVTGIILIILIQLIRINIFKSDNRLRGKLSRSKVLMVGDEKTNEQIITKIHSRPDWNYEVVGTVSVNETKSNGAKMLGFLQQLPDLIKAYHIDQVYFDLRSISYREMLRVISNLQGENVLFKLIPDSMDFILGKSNVEYLESIPFVEVDFGYAKKANVIIKRGVDICVSMPAVIFLLLVTFPAHLFSKAKKEKISGMVFYSDVLANKWKNWARCFMYVLSGRLSLVGTPIEGTSIKYENYKPGLTGLLQVNSARLQTVDEKENYELYYLQNYSVWMDIDIMMKTIFNGPSPIKNLHRAFQKV